MTSPITSKLHSTPSRSFIIQVPTPSYFESCIEELDESVSLYNNNSERESISNISNIENFIIPFHSKGDVNEDSILFKSTYSFIQTYLSVLKTSNIVSTYPLILKFSLKVDLRDHTIEENFFSFVKYQLEGTYSDKPFSVSRRYKEFIAYRELLAENWPGLLIHPIPPKKLFGNLDDSFINLRKKYLQQFLNKICASPHLASSYETKIFLESRNENFLDLPIEVYIRPVEDIYKIYSSYFDFLIYKELTQNEKRKVQNFYLALTKTKENLENLNYVITEAKNVEMESEDLFETFFEHNFLTENAYFDLMNFSSEDKNALNKTIIEANLTELMYRTKYDSVYTTFYEWVNSVIIETDAMIETISTLYKYNQTFEGKIEQLKALNEKLHKASNHSAIRNFFFPVDLNKIQMIINEIKKLKGEIDTYKKLIDLIYKILYFIEIPTFKRDQVNFYSCFINKIIEDQEHSHKKHSVINSLLKGHCATLMSIIGNIKES